MRKGAGWNNIYVKREKRDKGGREWAAESTSAGAGDIRETSASHAAATRERRTSQRPRVTSVRQSVTRARVRYTHSHRNSPGSREDGGEKEKKRERGGREIQRVQTTETEHERERDKTSKRCQEGKREMERSRDLETIFFLVYRYFVMDWATFLSQPCVNVICNWICCWLIYDYRYITWQTICHRRVRWMSD